MAHRVRIGLEGKCRICTGRRAAADRRRDGMGAGNRRGRKVTRKHRGPSFELGRVHAQRRGRALGVIVETAREALAKAAEFLETVKSASRIAGSYAGLRPTRR